MADSNMTFIIVGTLIIAGLWWWWNNMDSQLTPIKNKGNLPPLQVDGRSTDESTDVYMSKELLDRRPRGSKNLPNRENDIDHEIMYGETGCRTGLCGANSCGPSKASDYQEVDEFDDYFNTANRAITGSQISAEDDTFVPNDETGGRMAPYDCNPTFKRTKHSKRYESDGSFDPDMYDPKNLLPDEIHDDWFEVIDEPVALKNRHLINLQQPLGINTVGSSLRNASLDLRGNPPCPKVVASPWNQSTIEPDYNIKPLY